MPDLIKLLPDSVANQIAAGEVVQRPASIVKELMENAIDAGATEVKTIIKDGGKTLVQVIDNGCGMSETDARLCFERHSTSKISSANDLFAIKTMGFRGEALASIAAIAHIELKTKRIQDELGTKILIEGSKVKEQVVEQCPAGSSFAIKNLFFNIPARRKFLKSDKAENYHIINEFQRVALANPEVRFSLDNNGKQIFVLHALPLKQRIVNLFGKKAKEMLLPVEQETDMVNISGFIGKPGYAKKRRGEQFFFVNHRFMRHPLFHRFVEDAFKGLIAEDAIPAYFIYFDVDPQQIDINIHPTKTEVKFENEQVLGATLRAAVRQAIGKHNILPTLDFETEKSFDNIPKPKEGTVKPPSIDVNPNFNPFDNQHQGAGSNKKKEKDTSQWKKLFEGLESSQEMPGEKEDGKSQRQVIQPEWDDEMQKAKHNIIFQVHNKYIFSQIKSGLMIIDQQAAHERILYEKYVQVLNNSAKASQQSLFPKEIEMSQAEIQVIASMEEDYQRLGFDIKVTGETTVMINGSPAEAGDSDPEELLRNVVESYYLNTENLDIDTKTNLAVSLAKNLCIKAGQLLKREEMQSVIDNLFACETPYASPHGKATFTTFTLDELEKKFH